MAITGTQCYGCKSHETTQRFFLIRANIAGTRCELDGPGKDTWCILHPFNRMNKTPSCTVDTLPPTIKLEQYLIQAPVIPKGLPSIGYSGGFNGVDTIPLLFDIYNLFHAKWETMVDFLPPNTSFALAEYVLEKSSMCLALFESKISQKIRRRSRNLFSQDHPLSLTRGRFWVTGCLNIS